jgi:hypothetical protein
MQHYEGGFYLFVKPQSAFLPAALTFFHRAFAIAESLAFTAGFILRERRRVAGFETEDELGLFD